MSAAAAVGAGDFICFFGSTLRMAKLIAADGTVRGAETGRIFDAQEVPVSGLDELGAVVGRVAERPSIFAIRGQLIGGPTRENIRRLSHADVATGDAATVADVPRRWVALDVDGVPLPAGADICDLAACAGAAVDCLPAAFHGARALVQATAGHGIKPGARLRLWFWLSRPVGNAELKVWLAVSEAVDHAMFSPAQPIYTAAPVFEAGVVDHLPARLAWLPGEAEVVVPDISLPPRAERAPATALAGSTDIGDVVAAIEVIPNADAAWDDWSRVGMAVYATTAGADDGLAAWSKWSAKSKKHDNGACEERWYHWGQSPPTELGFGTLVHLAREAVPGWRPPAVAADVEFQALEQVPADDNATTTTLSDKMEILLKTDQAETAREIATAMGNASLIYQRDGNISRVIRGADGRVFIHTVAPDEIPHIFAEIGRVVDRNKSGEVVPVTMSRDLRSLVISAPAAPCGIPALGGIAAGPLLADDGGIRAVEGHDAATGLYALALPSLTVPDRPTEADATGALTRIRMALRGFAFADAATAFDAKLGTDAVDQNGPPGAAESAAIVALLSAVCRPSLPLAPGFMVTAPTGSGSGAGKGLLVRVIAAVAFGVAPRAFNSGRTAEELDKRLGAELLGGDPILLLDNCNATALKSDTLASVLTEAPARIRRLGYTEMATLSTKTFITVTGNGLTPSEDLVRRFLLCALDAKTENPEARGFKVEEEEFLATVAARRGELLSAAITIWRWGRQQHQLPAGQRLGSFGTWGRWCRDPLLALGCRDPVVQIAETRALDPYRQRLAEALAAWWHAHGDTPMKAADVADDVRALVDPHGTSRQSLAPKLVQLNGTRAGGFALECIPGSAARKAGATYRVVWADNSPSPTREGASSARKAWPPFEVYAGGRA